MPKQKFDAETICKQPKNLQSAGINWAQNDKQKTKAGSKLFEQKTKTQKPIWNPNKKQAELQKAKLQMRSNLLRSNTKRRKQS